MQKYFKIQLVLLLTLMTFSLKAQIINIPDANFKSALISLGVDKNGDGEIQDSEALEIDTLKIEKKNIEDLTGIASFKNLVYLNCSFNKLTSLNVTNLNQLRVLQYSFNKITSLDFSNLNNLEFLICQKNEIINLNLSNLTKLKTLNCGENPISELDISELSLLEVLNFGNCNLTNIDLSNLTNLKSLSCEYNMISSLDINHLKKLNSLFCNDNKITNILLNNLTELRFIITRGNPIKVLDLNNLDKIINLYIASPTLEYLYFNNKVDPQVINKDIFLSETVSNIKYICTSGDKINAFQQIFFDIGNTDIIINSLCSSTSDATFYSFEGEAKIDGNNNGCDEGDIAYPNLKIKISNTIDSGYILSGVDGNFSTDLNAGVYTFQPLLENSYYSINPKSAIFTLPDTISPAFCITPNGVYNDLSISVIPTIAARPGFSDATYKVVYKNQGTTTQNGSIAFNYEGTKMNFISSAPIADNTGAGNVGFNFTNLAPFETRSALITMRTNAPTDNPAVNSGDVLEFTAVITGATDETPEDNLATLNQTVVGSFDPNDKTCLEGEIVSPELIGKNVHYLIRFENTGTANAENIVVTDYIDTTVFEISTLQITDASHNCHTQISQGNKVQFIFSDIQLPFTEPDKHGYVAFSIKLKEDLVIGDSIKNKADIFFDYNLPVETNIASAEINYKTVTYIGNENTIKGSLDIYPNPSNGQFSLELKANIKAPVQISILNVEGKTVYTKSLNHQNQSNLSLDLQHLAKGVYLIQAQIENDVLSKKVVIQ